MAPRIAFDLNSLATTLPVVFDQVQTSVATHKKNSVALLKLHVASADVVESVNRGKGNAEVKLVGERAFAEKFLDMLNRALVIRKSTPAADRIVKFVATYVKFLNDKASETDDEETPSSRLTTRLLKYFLKGFQAKSKEVRFRCLSFVSEVIPGLGELDQDLYAELRAALLERLNDKEPLVRRYAVSALSMLAASEDPYDLEDDEPPIIDSLLASLTFDPASEVRRAALVHIPFTPSTLPALLTRMRDVDALTRKLVFTIVLPRLANPRQLTIAQREQIVSQGLGDRSETVRLAAARLLGTWVDTCEGDLAAFVALFDVHTSNIARDALKSVFVTRAEIADEIEFDDTFWTNLKPETALLARAFVEHCIDKSDETRLESTLPVVTSLAFRLQSEYNKFVEFLQAADVDDAQGSNENDASEEQLVDSEFIMNELLLLAAHLDYSDEIGRRKMFGVVRNMLAHPELPEGLIEPCVGVLHVMSPNERDLILIVVEVISELRDSALEDHDQMAIESETYDGETTFGSSLPRSTSQSREARDEMTPEKRLEADIIDLRCLNLCIAVLGRVQSSFEENSSLRGVLEELIVPSVQRKELALREKGLVSLGLCCLIAKNMALSSFQLFLGQVKSAPEALRMKVLQVVFDIMMTYEKDFFGSAESIGERVITFLMQALETEESKNVQTLMCLGLAKLMLFGLVTDERVLMSLIFVYVSPTNSDNQDLRQCLAYFLPVYCYSSAANQTRLQSVFVKTLDLIFETYEELEDDQDMISPLQFGSLLTDWTDPSKLVGADDQKTWSPVHLNLAIDIVRALYDNERAADERKTLCLLLAKFVFPTDADEHVLYSLYILTLNLPELCPFEDSSTDRAFIRFKSRFEKHFSIALAEYDEQRCFCESDSAYDEVFEFLGITRPRARRFIGKASDAAATKPSRSRHGNEDHAEQEATTEGDTVQGRSRGGRNTKLSSKARKNDASSSDHSQSSYSENDENQTTKAKQRPRKTEGSSSGNTRRNIAAVAETAEPSESEPKASEHRESEVEDEDKGTPPLPSTPPGKKGAKRLHSPTKSPTMASPAPKRRNQGARAKVKNETNSKTLDASRTSSKVVTSKRSESTTTSNYRRHAPLRNTEEDDDDSDGSSSNASIPQRQQRSKQQRNSRPPPRVMEDKIGWDHDSSDF